MSEKAPIRHDEIQGDIVHEYDGIEEADNQLPLWWLTLFFGAIVFGIAYWFAYHEYDVAKLPGEAYASAVARQEFEAEERAKELAAKTGGGGIAALAKDPGSVEAGRNLFVVNCVACHGQKGEGLIGPNLTDSYWLHGGSGESIHEIIEKGVVEKGMPAWGPTLGPLATQQLAAYVVSIRGTNVPGKEPQGEEWVAAAE